MASPSAGAGHSGAFTFYKAGDYADAADALRAWSNQEPSDAIPSLALGCTLHRAAQQDSIATSSDAAAAALQRGLDLALTTGLPRIATEGEGGSLTWRLHPGLEGVLADAVSTPGCADDTTTLKSLGLVRLYSSEEEVRHAASEPLSRAAALDPSDYTTQCLLALALLETECFEEAVEACEAAISVNPGCPTAHCHKARVLQRIQPRDPDELDRTLRAAEASADRAIEIEPTHAESHYVRALVLISFDRVEEAGGPLERAFRLNPLHPLYAFTYAGYLKEGGRDAEALEAFNKGWDLFQDGALMKCTWGETVDVEEFLDHREQFEVSPESRQPGEAGFDLYEAQHFHAAEQQFRKGVEDAPQDPIPHFALGCALHRLSRHDAADAALRQGLSLRPDRFRGVGSASNCPDTDTEDTEDTATSDTASSGRPGWEPPAGIARALADIASLRQGDPTVLRCLASLRLLQGRASEAADALRAAVEQQEQRQGGEEGQGSDPSSLLPADTCETLALLSIALMADGCYAAAESAARSAVAAAPKSAPAARDEQGNGPAPNPLSSSAHCALGRALLCRLHPSPQQGGGGAEGSASASASATSLSPTLSEPIACLRLAAAANPTSGEPLFVLSSALSASGDLIGAGACLREAHDLNPEHPLYSLDCAYFLQQAGCLKASREHLYDAEASISRGGLRLCSWGETLDVRHRLNLRDDLSEVLRGEKGNHHPSLSAACAFALRGNVAGAEEALARIVAQGGELAVASPPTSRGGSAHPAAAHLALACCAESLRLLRGSEGGGGPRNSLLPPESSSPIPPAAGPTPTPEESLGRAAAAILLQGVPGAGPTPQSLAVEAGVACPSSPPDDAPLPPLPGLPWLGGGGAAGGVEHPIPHAVEALLRGGGGGAEEGEGKESTPGHANTKVALAALLLITPTGGGGGGGGGAVGGAEEGVEAARPIPPAARRRGEALALFREVAAAAAATATTPPDTPLSCAESVALCLLAAAGDGGAASDPSSSSSTSTPSPSDQAALYRRALSGVGLGVGAGARGATTPAGEHHGKPSAEGGEGARCTAWVPAARLRLAAVLAAEATHRHHRATQGAPPPQAAEAEAVLRALLEGCRGGAAALPPSLAADAWAQLGALLELRAAEGSTTSEAESAFSKACCRADDIETPAGGAGGGGHRALLALFHARKGRAEDALREFNAAVQQGWRGGSRAAACRSLLDLAASVERRCGTDGGGGGGAGAPLSEALAAVGGLAAPGGASAARLRQLAAALRGWLEEGAEGVPRAEEDASCGVEGGGHARRSTEPFDEENGPPDTPQKLQIGKGEKQGCCVVA